MSATQTLDAAGNPTTRRQVISGAAIALASLAASSRARAGEPTSTKEAAGAPGNKTRTSLQQEVRFATSPQRVYDILLSSQQFTAFSGAPATIDAKVGGVFSLFGGMIVGVTVELAPAQRIVQAWRPSGWEPGVYSLARMDLASQGSETVLRLDHKGFPLGAFDHLGSGWHEHYWQPLTKFLASAGAK